MDEPEWEAESVEDEAAPLPSGSKESPISPTSYKKMKRRIKDKRPPRIKRYFCRACTKGFDRPCSLEQHERTHTGERPHPCVRCGKPFTTKSNLYRHQRRCPQGPLADAPLYETSPSFRAVTGEPGPSLVRRPSTKPNHATSALPNSKLSQLRLADEDDRYDSEEDEGNEYRVKNEDEDDGRMGGSSYSSDGEPYGTLRRVGASRSPTRAAKRASSSEDNAAGEYDELETAGYRSPSPPRRNQNHLSSRVRPPMIQGPLNQSTSYGRSTYADPNAYANQGPSASSSGGAGPSRVNPYSYPLSYNPRTPPVLPPISSQIAMPYRVSPYPPTWSNHSGSFLESSERTAPNPAPAPHREDLSPTTPTASISQRPYTLSQMRAQAPPTPPSHAPTLHSPPTRTRAGAPPASEQPATAPSHSQSRSPLHSSSHPQGHSQSQPPPSLQNSNSKQSSSQREPRHPSPPPSQLPPAPSHPQPNSTAPSLSPSQHPPPQPTTLLMNDFVFNDERVLNNIFISAISRPGESRLAALLSPSKDGPDLDGRSGGGGGAGGASMMLKGAMPFGAPATTAVSPSLAAAGTAPAHTGSVHGQSSVSPLASSQPIPNTERSASTSPSHSSGGGGVAAVSKSRSGGETLSTPSDAAVPSPTSAMRRVVSASSTAEAAASRTEQVLRTGSSSPHTTQIASHHATTTRAGPPHYPGQSSTAMSSSASVPSASISPSRATFTRPTSIQSLLCDPEPNEGPRRTINSGSTSLVGEGGLDTRSTSSAPALLPSTSALSARTDRRSAMPIPEHPSHARHAHDSAWSGMPLAIQKEGDYPHDASQVKIKSEWGWESEPDGGLVNSHSPTISVSNTYPHHHDHQRDREGSSSVLRERERERERDGFRYRPYPSHSHTHSHSHSHTHPHSHSLSQTHSHSHSYSDYVLRRTPDLQLQPDSRTAPDVQGSTRSRSPRPIHHPSSTPSLSPSSSSSLSPSSSTHVQS